MENKVSSSNPNIKNIASPSSKSTVTGQQQKFVPVQPKVIQNKNPRLIHQANLSENAKNGNSDEPDLIDKIREDSEKRAGEEKKEGAKPAEKKDDKDKEKIRIVIRDAKPPLLARILQGFMRVICLLLIIAVCGIGIPRLFGINEFNVLTGSMLPTYPVGSLVFVQPKDPSTIRPGEVVTCIMDDDLNMVTHRVQANNYEDKTIITKGDANNSEDAPSLYENVVGVVVFSIPYVGGLVDYMTNDANGRIFGIGVVLSILALTFIAEGICYVLTKQSASVYNKNDKKDAGSGGKGGKGDKGKSDYDVKTVNARKFNREFKRGKGAPVMSVPLRGSKEEQELEKKKQEQADKSKKKKKSKK